MNEHKHESDPLPEGTYDRLRAAAHFTTPPALLARLAVSDAAADLADRAGGLVPTSSDGYRHRGDLVEDAAQLLSAAQEVLAQAVVAERARGATWEEIGDALAISRQAAQERFRVPAAAWERGLDRPYVPSAGGKILNPQLPHAALAPHTAAEHLDRWVHQRTQPGDPDRGARPVSAVLADRDGWALGLSSAVIASSRRLLDSTTRLEPAPGEATHERTLAERKVALYEVMLVEKPGDVATLDQLAAARARLAELQAGASET